MPTHQLTRYWNRSWMSSLVTNLMPNGGDLLDDHATPGYSRLTAAHWHASDSPGERLKIVGIAGRRYRPLLPFRAVFKGGYGFKPPWNVEKKIFWQCKKHFQRNVSADALCLHYCDARKSHLASIKCKKPLGWPGLHPGPHWGSLQRSPKPPSWWGGGWLPPPQEPHPRSRPFRPRLSPPPIFNPPPKTKILAMALPLHYGEGDDDAGKWQKSSRRVREILTLLMGLRMVIWHVENFTMDPVKVWIYCTMPNITLCILREKA